MLVGLDCTTLSISAKRDLACEKDLLNLEHALLMLQCVQANQVFLRMTEEVAFIFEPARQYHKTFLNYHL